MHTYTEHLIGLLSNAALNTVSEAEKTRLVK